MSNFQEINGNQNWLPAFFKISCCVLIRRKKVIQVWINMRVCKWWQNFLFWVDFHFFQRIGETYLAKSFVSGSTGLWKITCSSEQVSKQELTSMEDVWLALGMCWQQSKTRTSVVFIPGLLSHGVAILRVMGRTLLCLHCNNRGHSTPEKQRAIHL